VLLREALELKDRRERRPAMMAAVRAGRLLVKPELARYMVYLQ
jgi:hypothetical protein